MREAYDISNLKGLLQSENDFQELLKAIRRYEASESILRDIDDCLRCVTTIKEIYNDDTLRGKFGGALLTHAVVTYCRAAHSKQDARFNIGVTKKYSEEQRAAHKQITDLRDRVISHFGFPGEEHGKSWVDERAIYKLTDEGDGICFVWKRANFLKRTVENFENILTNARKTTVEILRLAKKNLDELLEANMEDERLRKAVRASPFDADNFFVSDGAAERFWGGGASGRLGEAKFDDDYFPSKSR